MHVSVCVCWGQQGGLETGVGVGGGGSLQGLIKDSRCMT